MGMKRPIPITSSNRQLSMVAFIEFVLSSGAVPSDRRAPFGRRALKSDISPRELPDCLSLAIVGNSCLVRYDFLTQGKCFATHFATAKPQYLEGSCRACPAIGGRELARQRGADLLPADSGVPAEHLCTISQRTVHTAPRNFARMH